MVIDKGTPSSHAFSMFGRERTVPAGVHRDRATRRSSAPPGGFIAVAELANAPASFKRSLTVPPCYLSDSIANKLSGFALAFGKYLWFCYLNSTGLLQRTYTP